MTRSTLCTGVQYLPVVESSWRVVMSGGLQDKEYTVYMCTCVQYLPVVESSWQVVMSGGLQDKEYMTSYLQDQAAACTSLLDILKQIEKTAHRHSHVWHGKINI